MKISAFHIIHHLQEWFNACDLGWYFIKFNLPVCKFIELLGVTNLFVLLIWAKYPGVQFYHMLQISRHWHTFGDISEMSYMSLVQAVLYNASTATHDILGCCLWCVVLGASKSETWRDAHRIRREVNYFIFNCHEKVLSGVVIFCTETNFLCKLSTMMHGFILNAVCRVRDIISVRAGLKKVPWDGYLKYSRPSPKHRERK